MSWLQLGHHMCHSIRRGVRVWVHVQVFDDACVFVRWSMLPLQHIEIANVLSHD